MFLTKSYSVGLNTDVSRPALWIGRILSGIGVLFLLMDGAMKLVKPPQVTEAMQKLGYPDGMAFGLGVLLLDCTLLYAFRRTSVLGAVLMTGYLGGAISTHVRAETGTFSIVFPLIVAAMLWGGLYLREPRLHALLPLRS